MTRNEVMQAQLDGKAGEKSVCDVWGDWGVCGIEPEGYFYPERWRLKPTKRKVTLGPEDVPPGSVFTIDELGPNAWIAAAQVTNNGVFLDDNNFRAFQTLKDSGWLIKRPGEDWQPCEKEVEGC